MWFYFGMKIERSLSAVPVQDQIFFCRHWFAHVKGSPEWAFQHNSGNLNAPPRIIWALSFSDELVKDSTVIEILWFPVWPLYNIPLTPFPLVSAKKRCQRLENHPKLQFNLLPPLYFPLQPTPQHYSIPRRSLIGFVNGYPLSSEQINLSCWYNSLSIL